LEFTTKATVADLEEVDTGSYSGKAPFKERMHNVGSEKSSHLAMESENGSYKEEVIYMIDWRVVPRHWNQIISERQSP
jgi:hypothetical protein